MSEIRRSKVTYYAALRCIFFYHNLKVMTLDSFNAFTVSVTPQSVCVSILKLQQLTFSNSIMLNICCKCLLADDLYYFTQKKNKAATNPFYFDRLSLT